MIDEYLKYFQLVANTFALGLAGWIYVAYTKSQNAALAAKDEQVKAVEKNIAFWKDKVQDLEKRTPEHMEEVLSKRIKTREEEIQRLREDQEGHQKEIQTRNEELLRLKSELEKTRDVRKGMDLLSLDLEEYLTVNDSELEIEQIGFVSVDSGQLMITDPCYIRDEWQEEVFEDIRICKDVETSLTYQYGKDFQRYNETIKGFNDTVSDLIESGRFEELEIARDYNFSYAGASYASMSKNGHGQLSFKLGHKGAGIAIKTVMGDGDYPVFAEKYNDEIVRVYVNLV